MEEYYIIDKLSSLISIHFNVWYYDRRTIREIAKRIKYIGDNKEKYIEKGYTIEAWYKNRTLIREFIHGIFKDLNFTNIKCNIIDMLELNILSFLGNRNKVVLGKNAKFKYNIDYAASINNDEKTILSDQVDYSKEGYLIIDYDMLKWLLQYEPYMYLIKLLSDMNYYNNSIFRVGYNTVKVLKEYLNSAEKIYKRRDYLSLTYELDKYGEWVYAYLLKGLTMIGIDEVKNLITRINRTDRKYISESEISISDYAYRQAIGMDKNEICKTGVEEKEMYNLGNIFNSCIDGRFFIETMIRNKMYNTL